MKKVLMTLCAVLLIFCLSSGQVMAASSVLISEAAEAADEDDDTSEAPVEDEDTVDEDAPEGDEDAETDEADKEEEEGPRWVVTKKFSGSIIGASEPFYEEIVAALETDPSLASYKQYMMAKYTSNEYDDRGNLLRTYSGDMEDRLEPETEYFYDEEDRQIKIVKYSYGNVETTTNEYDENGDLICVQVVAEKNGEVSTETTRYEYDEYHNETHMEYLRDPSTVNLLNESAANYVNEYEDGVLVSRSAERKELYGERWSEWTCVETYEYDEEGRLIRHDYNDYSDQAEIYAYDAFGELVTSLEDKGYYYSGYVSTLDEDGYVIDRTTYIQTTELKTYYENDEAGKPVASWSDAMLENGQKTYYEYDDNGLLLQTVTRDEEGNTYGFAKYEYDENGNRIRMIYLNNSASGVTLRLEETEYQELP